MYPDLHYFNFYWSPWLWKRLAPARAAVNTLLYF